MIHSAQWLSLFFLLLINWFTVNGQNLSELDSIANYIVETYKVKGIAMVGTKDGNIVYSKGFGRANESFDMNSETPLYIASNTKAFVGLAMAQLIAKERIALNDPLIKYIKRTYFPDSLSVESITIEEVISHNHGLSNDPMTFRTSWSGEYPEDLQELLKYTSYYPEGDSLTKQFRYSNFSYLLAGIVIENVTGMHWKDYLTKHVFIPLKMYNTTAKMPEADQYSKMAVPYNFTSETPLKIVKSDETLHAAGGLFSNLTDMTKWLSFCTEQEVQSGAFPEDLSSYFEPLVPVEDGLGPLKINGYGYGWYFGSFFDKSLNFHTGGFSGHASFMSYMPEENLGFFIFINERSSMFRSALQLVLVYYTLMTEHPGKNDVNEMFSGMTKKIYENYKPTVLEVFDAGNHELPTGTFYNEKYGTLRIVKKIDTFELYFGDNLHSLVYKGDSNDEFLTEFVPGSIEHFFVEIEDNKIRLRYGDGYGYFYPLK